jgi:hypothetical protein
MMGMINRLQGMIDGLQGMLDEVKRLRDIVERRWRSWMWKGCALGCALVAVFFVATWVFGGLFSSGDNRNEPAGALGGVGAGNAGSKVVKQTQTWTVKETPTKQTQTFTVKETLTRR